MKRILLVFALITGTIGALSAQVDVKAGPVGLLFRNFNLGIEFGATPNVGIEVTSGIDWKKLPLIPEENLSGRLFKVGLNGRYYFNPNQHRLSGFYTGVYTRYAGGEYDYIDPETNEPGSFRATRAAAGFLLGGKIVSKNGRIVFDLGFGLGRQFIHKYVNADGTQTADVSKLPFINLDMPINLKIGYRFGGGSN